MTARVAQLVYHALRNIHLRTIQVRLWFDPARELNLLQGYIFFTGAYCTGTFFYCRTIRLGITECHCVNIMICFHYIFLSIFYRYEN